MDRVCEHLDADPQLHRQDRFVDRLADRRSSHEGAHQGVVGAVHDDGHVPLSLGDVALGRRRLRLEAHTGQPDRLEQPLADVVLVRDARDALDDDAEQRERQVGVVEPRA